MFFIQSKDNNFETLVASVQEQLRKVNYENFVLMKDSCVYADQTSSGFIPVTEMRNIVKSFKLPIQEYLLQALLEFTKSDGEGNIDYVQFIQLVNWRDHPGMFLSSLIMALCRVAKCT